MWNIKIQQFQNEAAFDHPPGCRSLGRSELILTVLTVWHQWPCQDGECCLFLPFLSVWSKQRRCLKIDAREVVLWWTFDHCTRILSSRLEVARPKVARSSIDLFKENTLFGCTQDRQQCRCQAWMTHFGCLSFSHRFVNLEEMFLILCYFVFQRKESITVSTKLLIIGWPGKISTDPLSLLWNTITVHD